MNLDYRFSRFYSHLFLIGCVLFVALLIYATMRANQVANAWQAENDQVVETMTSIR